MAGFWPILADFSVFFFPRDNFSKMRPPDTKIFFCYQLRLGKQQRMIFGSWERVLTNLDFCDIWATPFPGIGPFLGKCLPHVKSL